MKSTSKGLIIVSLLVLVGFGCSAGSFLSGSDLNTSDSGSDILFQDDFSDTGSGWSTLDEDGDKIDYSDGGFRFTLNDTNFDYWSTPDINLTDAHIEVDATKLGGPDDNDYGLVCRYQDEENFYGLLISSDGYYGISKMKDGEHNLISAEKLQFSEDIRTGLSTNRVGADCIGDTLRLYVNGKTLVEVKDTEFTSGDIGLLAGTYDTPGVDVIFDNMVVTKP